MMTSAPKSVGRTASDVVSLVMRMIRSPTSTSGRYARWVRIGWKPIPFQGKGAIPDQERFRLKVTIHRRKGERVDVWAETGESLEERAVIRPHMEVVVHVLYDPDEEPRCLSEIAASLHQTARHEIEHLLDEGYLAVSGPERSHGRRTRIEGQESWQRSIRLTHWLCTRVRLFARDKITPRSWSRADRKQLRSSSDDSRVVDYIVSPRELHAFVKGFQAEAKCRGVHWDVPMHEYVDSMINSGRMTQEEAETSRSMLTRWAVHVIPLAPIREETLSRYL